jgi:hypothetical protein
MINFTRAVAASENSLTVCAIRDGSEPYMPDARLFQYEHLGHGPRGDRWFYDDFPMSIQDIIFARDIGGPERPSYYAHLSSEGEIHHSARPEQYLEIIPGTGADEIGHKFYGYVYTLRQIGERLYACGAGGQIYVRYGRDDWRMLTDAVLFDPEARERQKEQEEAAGNVAPPRGSEEWIQWRIQRALNPPSRNILFLDIQGLSEEAIYLCGVVGPGAKPVLCYWDGATLEELKVPMEEAALTGIHIENPDSVWVCGREGVLLHGSRSRGFNPVPGDRRLNLFHHITPYRGKLVMPASVRPGGLWEFDPGTGAFGRFNPPLPPLTPPPKELYEAHGGPFFAQAVGDILWVVAPRDIYRFDGHEWERIKHPDLP